MTNPTWTEVDTSGWHPEDRGVIYAIDTQPGHLTEWHCPPPPEGAWYQALEEDWVTATVEDRQPVEFIVVHEDNGRVLSGQEHRTIPVRRIYSFELKQDS